MRAWEVFRGLRLGASLVSGPSGYTSCKCRDCFEIAVSDDMDDPDFCGDCEEAGCEEDDDCQVLPEEEDTCRNED